MKLQELFRAMLANLPFNRKLVVQIPVRSSEFSRPNRGGLIKFLILFIVFSLVMIPAGQVQAASFVVNSTADQPDASPGNGVCATGSGACTLRAAIMEANSSPGADTITIPAGVYALGIPTINDDLDTTGDFDIYSPMTIDGEGAGVTIIDGGFPPPGSDPTARGMDRLFEIHPTSGNVTFKDLTLREGYSVDDGGAVQNWSSGLLRIENVHVLDSYAGGAGGGINNADPAFYEWVVAPLNPPKSGRVEIINSTLSGNAASIGAAVNNTSNGTVSILAGSQVVDNPGEMIPDPAQVIDPLDPEPIEYIPAPGVYEPRGGAIANQGATDTIGTVLIADSTVSGNFATSNGAGVLNDGSGTLIVENSTFSNNSTEAGGGGLYTTGGTVTVTGSTFSGNVAHDGGGIYSNGSVDTIGLRPSFTLTDSTISDNESHASGGGMYNGGEAHLVITDVTFSGNFAHDAGGGLNSGDRSSAIITRVTFSNNETNNEGGGAKIGSERLVTITDSVFDGNDAGIPEPGDVFDPLGANIAGGGGLYTEGGALTITGSTFSNNTSTEEGGGLSIDNSGDVKFSDSVIRNNRAGHDGGGVENSGFNVTFERLLIENNYAVLHGGGIYNSSSGPFTILDTTVQLNSAVSGGGMANAPDNDLIVRRSLFLRNIARNPGISEDGDIEEGGLGGGIFSLADGDALIESTTFSGNTASKGGGGLFHDADGEVKLINVTIWRNSAPRGGGLGVAESDFVPDIPPKANTAVIARNSIIGGSLKGGSCDWYITSEGGNIDGLGTQAAMLEVEGALLPVNTYCFLYAPPTSDISLPAARDRRSATFTVDALADNGGPTLTHAINSGSLAQDAGVTPCPETDQRGIARPQNGACDVGAYEFVGDPLPPDAVPPETEFGADPFDDGIDQDGLETMSIRFRGSDNLTSQEDLMFECRLFEQDLAEQPEPLAPWDPIPVELWWVSCSNPWQVPLLEAELGLFQFEVRAIDRNGNVDPTPVVHTFGPDLSPPDTFIVEMPPSVTNSRSATFSFSGTDNITPPQFMEFECRLDSRDPELWLECFNPTFFSNLTSGQHTLEVRAYDGAESVDPSPARYTWTVGQVPGSSCDLANITLTPVADGWIDEVNQLENYLFETELNVRSSSVGDPTAVPPEPVIGENARALFRFALPTDYSNCVLESATLRLYNESPTEGRNLQAVPLAETWLESTLTWFNQPDALGAPVTIPSRLGYQEWDVTGHVLGMLQSGVSYGWQIRDANENDPDGGDQSFLSREMPQDPPDMTLPQLVLRYAADTNTPTPEPPAEPTGPAVTVHCGQVLTQSTLVANDLSGCIGEGLVIGAPNIVVDLNGHSITSSLLLPEGQEGGGFPGIRNGSHTNVIIRNGTINSFDYGVVLGPGTTHNIVGGFTLTANRLAGIYLFDADDGRTGNTIRNNHFDHNLETGLWIANDSENSLIENNTFIGNGMSIYLFSASGHTIRDNDISGVVLNPLLGSDAGIVLEEGSNHNEMIDNDISDTGDAGIIIHMGSHDNIVQGGLLTRNGDAGVIIEDADRTQVIGILSHQQSDGGVVMNNAHGTIVRDSDLRFNPSGVEHGSSHNVRIENNDGSDSLQAGFEIGNGLNIIVRNNVANHTGGAGISMEGAEFDALGNPIGPALIEGNTTNENAGDGITVADGGHRIRNNTAYNNAGYGILAGEAVEPGGLPSPGANIDGGGNIAAGNAEPEQCVGVVCATGAAPPLTPVDLTAPETSITGMPLNPTSSTSATFTFTGSDNAVPLTALVFECRLDPLAEPPVEPEIPDLEPPDPGAPPDVIEPPEGTGWVECISPVRYNGLEQGTHRFEVRALDLSDNFDLTPAVYEWEVDFTAASEQETGPDAIAPSTRIASAPADPTTETMATFHFTGSDNLTLGKNLTYQCQIDGGGFSACTSPQTYIRPPGTYTFEVRALDLAGNPDATPAVHTWKIVESIDNLAPDTSIDSGPDPVTVLPTATFTFSSNEAGVTFECGLGEDPTFGSCTSPQTITGLLFGDQEFSVRAVDGALNVDPAPATYLWTISSAPVPTTVYCGQVLTHSVQVRNDLYDCLWDGLVVGADKITIDLNGHTIDGKGIAAGIRNDGYDSVSIKNGTIVDFDYGVMLNPGTTHNIVDGLALQNNQEAGIALGLVPHPLDPTMVFPLPPPPTFQSGVRDNILRNNSLLANDIAIWLTNGTRNTQVHDNSMAANGSQGIWIERSHNNLVEANDIHASGAAGVELEGSSGNTIAGNILSENGGGVILETTAGDAGYMPSNDNLVQHNIITESGGPGIELAGSSNGTVSGNQILDNIANYSNGEGIRLYYARDTLVRGNDLRSNSGGVSVDNSSDNRIESNDASHSGGDGIAVSDHSTNNKVVGNMSSNNQGTGISVSDEVAGDSGTLVEGNTANNNAAYGIHVPKVSHIIKNNIANENGSWGIYASAGSNGRFNIDGGGNRAQGNLGPIDPFTFQPLQCFVIRCDGGDVPPDPIPPDTLILQAPSNPSSSTSATFHFNGSDNVGHVTFECRMDGVGMFTSCASPQTYSGLSIDSHTFEVRAVDISGNVDATAASYSWTINASSGAVETTILSGPDGTTVRTDATFEFSASDGGSSFECSLDGEPFAGCTSPWTYTDLGVGPHAFSVLAAGDLTPATYAWNVGAGTVPAVIGCGQIIVQSTLLLNDLVDCGGHGLIVGAPGITIDLNGHFIDGVGLDAGILNNGYDSVTITNGTITQFDYGILLNPGTSRNVIDLVQLEANAEAGLLLSDADQNGAGNTIRNNSLLANGTGIWLTSNTRNTVVTGNVLSGNSADGIFLEFASDNQIASNQITRSGGSAIMMMSGGNNTVVDNTLSGNGGFGIAVGEELLPSNNNLIEHNTIDEGQGGISVADSSGNQILYNIVRGTTGPGVVIELSSNTLVRGNDLRANASGIDVSESNDNRIEANNASGTLGSGIAIDALSYNNVVVQNMASQNGGSGIELEGSILAGQTNLVEGNIADGNGGDGISVLGVGYILTGNSTQLNGGWGIYAPIGATNGGGNFAAGNMEPWTQCYGFVCVLGVVPGAPETWIVAGPVDSDLGAAGIQSNSRNASFTYMGSDNASPLLELVFECRLDSTNDLAWVDCEYPAEYLNLSPGVHVFEVRTIDMLGWPADPTPARFEWTYVPLPSGVAPTVILDIVPENPSVLFEALFTFHGNEPDITFECKVDFWGYEPCGFEGVTYMSQGAYEAAFAETEVGNHTFYVRAIDFEGNVGEPTTYTWSITGIVTTFTDGPGFTPGETPLDPPTGGPVTSSTATLDFVANVADATYECSLDLGPFLPCTPPVTYTGLIAGDHFLQVVATDVATEASEMEAAVFEWEVVEFVDSNPPETTIELAPANNSSATMFEFTGVDDLTPPVMLLFQCRIDSTNELDWFECVSPFNLLDMFTYEDFQMAPGQHTFEVRQIDIAEPLFPDPANPEFEGNIDPTPATYTWTMAADTTPPGTGILSGPPATVGEGEILFEFFGADNATPLLALTFECAVDAGPFEPCTSPESVQGLLPGADTFSVRAVDLAGNAHPTPATSTFTVMPAPVTTISSGPAGQIIDGVLPASPSTTESAIFVFSADQPGSTFECSLNGGLPAALCDAAVVEVAHAVRERAMYPEGVVGDPPAVYEWLVDPTPDNSPPNTTITSAPPNPDTNTVATFSFSGSDNRTLAVDLTFQCALDGTAYNSCVAPQQFSDLTHGSHTMLIRARYAAGNFDPTPASYTWFVELPPVTTILTGPVDITESTSATFTFQANLAGSTYTCWMDGLMEACTSGITYTGLFAGDHLFAVLATGPGGSIEQAWAEWEWTIADTTPPITTISSGPDIQTESTSATFEFSANEPVAAFMCSLDGATSSPCTSPQEYPFLWPGPHSFEVVGLSPLMVDQFGQPIEPLFDPIPVLYEWTIIDVMAPETTITYGPAATTASTAAYFGVSSDDPFATIECSLDGAGFSSCESPAVFEDLLPGAHTLVAQAVDVAGNVDASPATYSWTITQAAPNTPVGTNVVVELPLPGGGVATLTFLEVTLAGATTLDVLAGAPPLPAGYLLAGGTFYDINTTAEGEVASLCIPFNPADFPETAVRMLHFDGSMWIDVTTMSDPAGTVCGIPEGFSPFAIVSGSGLAPLASIISGPPNPSFSGIATFTFWADQPGSMILCSIDGLPFTPCTSPVTYTHLDAGDQTFMVQAIGPDGQIQAVPTLYEWEVILQVDTTPPDTTITSGAPSLTVSWINWFEFTGTDDQTAPLEIDFLCRLDGVDLGGCSSPEDIQVLAAGSHTFEVSAVDATGNVDPTPATWNFTVVDMSAPDTSIDLGPDSETTSTAAIFEFSGFEELTDLPVFQFDCSLDNAEFTDCTSPHEIAGLGVGPHVFQVRAKDLAGVVDPTPDFYEWLILTPPDTTAPDTFIVSGPPPDNSGPDVIFGFASNEPVEQFECSLDGGPFEGCDAVYELIALAQGQHTLLVRALDLAEIPNVDPTPAEYIWTTLGEPDTIILSGPPALSNSYSATFTFESDQAGATFQCSVDGSLYVPCTSPFLAGPLTEETHQLEVQAMNQFVNIDGEQIVDLTPATYEWEILDITPPDTTVLSVTFLGPTDLIEPNSYRFEFTGEDNRTASFELGFECSLDGGPFEGCDPIHYIPLEELTTGGEHVLHVRAVDALDNVDPTPASATFTTEAVPDTTIDSVAPDMGVDLQTESTEVTFTFSSAQAGVTFDCSLDLAPFTACTSPWTLTGVPYGIHEFQVRAVSPLGTVYDLEPAIFEWESGDMTPPVVTILSGPTAVSGPESTTTDTTATFTFSADDPAATFQCSLDGSLLAFCESGVTYTGLLAGEHTFEVGATKPNLLIEGLPAVWEWTVLDETAPETTILSGPAAEIGLGTPALFTFSSNELDATFECSLNGEPFAACAAPPDNTAEFSGLEAGAYTLEVRAVDPSLNADATPATYAFTVAGAPLTAILTAPEATTTETTATFTFSADQSSATFACALDGADFTPCTSGVVYSDLTVASHVFEVQATNQYGVLELAPVSYEWTVLDGTVPATTIVSGSPATTANTTAVFNFSSNELDAGFECRLDSSDPLAFAACSSPQTYTGLSVASHTFEVRAVDATGNTDATPASHTWTVEAPPPPNTPTGSNVTIAAGNATITFASVTAEGLTLVDTLGSTPALPDGYLQAGALYYDLSTTATYTGSVTVCLSYAPGSLTEPVRLLHYVGSAWVDVTTTNDPLAGIVCGEPGSLSPFAIATGTAAVVPDTTIDVGPPAFTASTSADFAFSSNDPLAIFECSLDNPLDWGSCTATTTLSGLTVGQHNLQVRAKNAAGNVDATPASYTWIVTPTPDTFIDSGPDNPTESTTATFNFSSDQPGVIFECAFIAPEGQESYVSCSSPQMYTGLGFGEYSFLVRALDADGNVDLTPADYDWEVGDIPAPVTITSGPGATTDSTSATFVFSADEPSPTYECSLDGAAFASCTSPKTYNGLALGNHTFQVRILNPAAVAEAPITTYTWTVTDLSAPDTVIDVGPASVTGLPEASFSFHSTESLSTFECSLDSAAYSACSSPASYSGLLAGEHTFSVRAIDAGGNADASPASYTWTYAPAPEITDLTAVTAETSTEATFSFTADQPDATFECSLDASLFAACASPVTYTGLGDGEHVFLVRAVNNYGIVNPSPEEYTWTVEATAPETTLTSSPPASTENTVATFSFSSNEAGVTFACSLDGVPFIEACLSPFTVSSLSVGVHTFEVTATDEAGNVDPTAAAYTWTVTDTTAPDTTITATPSSTTSSTSATFGFSSSESGSTFECSLDGAGFGVCSSPATYTGLAVTGHTFEVRAIDSAGNPDTSPASYSWTIVPPPDTTAPDTVITNQPPDPSPEAVNFAFSGTDNVTATLLLTYQCSLDAGAWTACTVPTSYTLPLGQHTFEVRAVDQAGNADSTPASYTWTVAITDTTPPETTIDSGPADGTDTNATFTFSSDDLGATFTCALDGGPSEPCTSPKSYTDLSVGDHQFLARAADAAGNVDQTAAVHEWTIEPLQTTINGIASGSVIISFAGGAETTDQSLFTFECSLDAGAWTACTSPVTYTAEGPHTFAVRAIGTDGSPDLSPATFSWTGNPTLCSMTGTISAEEDAWIDQNSSSNNFGQDAILKARSQGPADNFRTLVKFPLPVVPANCMVQSATLRLYSASWTNDRTLQALRVADTWTENTVTWLDQPTTTLDPAATVTTVLTINDYLAWDVTALLQADYAAETNNGFLIRDSIEDGTGAEQQLHSREKGEYMPELIITFAPIPDTTPPETMIDSGPEATTTSTGATFTFSASESGSTFECSLDGAAFAGCTSPAAHSGLAVGAHSFSVRAIDPAGNADATQASYSWTVEAPPPPVDCGPAVTLSASADAWIDQGSPTSNKGTDSILKVMSKSGNSFRALLQFNLPAAPQGCVIQSATLRLYAASYKSNRTLQALQVNGSWTENGVTWGNQPATTGAAATTSSGSGWRQWNVAAIVQAMYNSGLNYGFLIRDANENNDAEQQFHSREKGETMPELVITFAPAP